MSWSYFYLDVSYLFLVFLSLINKLYLISENKTQIFDIIEFTRKTHLFFAKPKVRQSNNTYCWYALISLVLTQDRTTSCVTQSNLFFLTHTYMCTHTHTHTHTRTHVHTHMCVLSFYTHAHTNTHSCVRTLFLSLDSVLILYQR